MVKAIPVRLLPHSGTYEPYTGTVGSVKTYGALVTMYRVRFEPVKQNAMTSLGDMKNDRFLLIYDCHNSQPEALTFKANDRIVYAGITLSVRKATSFFADSGEVHHYEVNCV